MAGVDLAGGLWYFRGMATRALSSDERRLAWAVRLAQADLAAWRDGDVLNATDELAEWLGKGKRGLHSPSAMRGPVGAVQAAIRAVLDEVMTARDAGTGTPPIRLRIDGYRTLTVPRDGRGPLVTGFEARAHSAAFALAAEAGFALADMLTRVDIGALRRCPECHQLFVREREPQRYDTSRCATRARVRAFTARQKGRPVLAKPPVVARTKVIERRPLIARSEPPTALLESIKSLLDRPTGRPTRS